MMTLTLNKQYYWLSLGIVCIVLFCSIIGYVIWQWRNDWVLTHQSVSNTPAFSFKKNNIDINNLPGLHLFGQSLNDGSMPITNLQLRVTGIVMIDNQNASKAYISFADQPSKIYRVGDRLGYGITIYAIMPDAVILENDGHFEKLLLPRQKLEFKPRIFKEE